MTRDDVIRFRCTDKEREKIQRLANERTDGNISRLIKQLIDKEGENIMKKYYVAEYDTRDQIDLHVYSSFNRDEAVTEAAAEWKTLTSGEKARRKLTVVAYEVPDTCETVNDAEEWMDRADAWVAGGDLVLELGAQ